MTSTTDHLGLTAAPADPSLDAQAADGGTAPTPAATGRSKSKRKHEYRPENTLAPDEKFLALLRDPTTWELANMLPRPGTGRPRAFHEVVYVLLNALTAVYGSVGHVQTVLSSKVSSDHLLELLLTEAGEHDLARPLDEEELRRAWPPQHHHIRDAGNLWMTESLDEYREILARSAADLARGLGMFDPSARSETNPRADTFVYGDGKVVTPRKGKPSSSDRPKPAPQLPERVDAAVLRALMTNSDLPPGCIDQDTDADPDAPDPGDEAADAAAEPHQDDHDVAAVPRPCTHHTGNGDAYGWKFTLLYARLPIHNYRVVLDCARQDGPSEADLAVELVRDVRARLGDGLVGVIWDTALRGTHILTLSRELGLLTVCPVSAKAMSKDRSTRWEKMDRLGSITHGECRHTLWTYGGAVALEKELDHVGNPQLELATLVKRERRQNDGSYRWYAEYTGTCRKPCL